VAHLVHGSVLQPSAGKRVLRHPQHLAAPLAPAHVRGTIVGNSFANRVNVPPQTPVLLELDSDTSSTLTASPVAADRFCGIQKDRTCSCRGL
jgi:hypothetical protein